MTKFAPISAASPITFEFINEYEGSRGPSLRVLRRDPRTGWKALPTSRALAAYHGKLALPKLAGQTVDIALAHVVFVNRKPLRLARLERDKWHFDDDGKIIQQDIFNHILNKLDSPQAIRGLPDGSDVFSADDLNAIRLVLGLGFDDS